MSLSVENLSFAYGAAPVLRDVSFTAEGGELVSVLGPNGVGNRPFPVHFRYINAPNGAHKNGRSGSRDLAAP